MTIDRSTSSYKPISYEASPLMPERQTATNTVPDAARWARVEDQIIHVRGTGDIAAPILREKNCCQGWVGGGFLLASIAVV